MTHPAPFPNDELYDPYQSYEREGYDPYAQQATRKYGSDLTQTSRSRNLRRWRHEHHGALWTKGGRGRCIGRFCCCSVMTIVFFIISILLALLLWVRPPNVIVGNVGAPSTGSEIQLESNGVQLNLAINITVNNPNYFTVSFSSIKANIYYPINHTLIGGGNQTSVTFPSHTNKTFTFPFSIAYTTTMPSSTQILADLVNKCGLNGGTTSDVTVDYDITLDVHVLFFTVSPTISNSASFLCPLSSSDLSGLLGGSG